MGRRANGHCGSRLLWKTLALVAVSMTVVLAAASARPASRTVTFRLDHFQCYRVDPTSPFKPRGVRLVDQFGRSKAVAVRLTSLCAPTRKNRSLVRNRLAHLACYQLRAPSFRVRRVVVTNQFGRLRLVVAKANELCLPSGKALQPGPTPRPVKLDHYQCYLIKPLDRFKLRKVLLVDQFGKSTPVVVNPVRLCAPARKNASRVLNRRDHLVCYQLRPLQPFRPRRALIVNQFGKATLVVVRPEWLCVPSLKRLVPTLPDLTVATSSTRTQVACPGGAGTCVTTVNFTITNASTTAVTSPFDVLVQADPGQSKTITVAGLAAGATQSFTQLLGPDGNCYDPDCTVRITVDSGSAIAESNETNNVATRTDLG
jgi:hypothetical protein